MHYIQVSDNLFYYYLFFTFQLFILEHYVMDLKFDKAEV